MMNIYELANKFDISIRKVRKMQKAGVLLIDDTEHPIADQMRLALSCGQPLSTVHLLALIKNPKLAWQLGSYEKRARTQAAALGDVKAGAAPLQIAAEICLAAQNDEDGISTLIAWMRETIPARPVGHHYIAVRLALGLPEQCRAEDVRRIPRALQNCRQRSSFAGWWRTEQVGTRNRIFYRQPEKPFDL
jgi:hypothetical protein